MSDLSGEKKHSIEYQASLETGQGRKLHEALPFFLSVKTTKKDSTSTIQSQMNTHLCSIT